MGVDVVRCEEVGLADAKDFEHLAYASAEGRTLITHDLGFRQHHAQWLMDGKHHFGIFLCAPHLQGADSSGRIIRDVMLYYELIKGGVGTVQDDFVDKLYEIK